MIGSAPVLVVALVAALAAEGSAAGPDDVLDFDGAFREELARTGEISPQEFARRHASKGKYRESIAFDPTTARYWTLVNRDPSLPRDPSEPRLERKAAIPGPNDEFLKWMAAQGKPVGRPGDAPGGFDFRLDPQELGLFRRNGFVVSERMGAMSFGEMFYRIYSSDSPVFVSTDAVLHAWHRSYDAMLKELEQTYLMASLFQILEGMVGALPEAHASLGKGVLGESIQDADYFLTVARSFLDASQVPSVLGNDPRVAQTLADVKASRTGEVELFGRTRLMDFSQFKPRGHYEDSEALRRYFGAMMWCGRIDLRVAGEGSSSRELGAALVLHHLLVRSGRFEQWQQFDRMLRTFVGRPDSMTFQDLGDVLAAANVRSPGEARDEATLHALQARILATRAGRQEIAGDIHVSPGGSEQLVLPRSFTLMGQRFVLDSWVTSKVVFDSIQWKGNKVERRVPSGLDVVFAALANDQTVPLLVSRMTATGGHTLRDGMPYQHNLTAARKVIDALEPSAWDESLYDGWISVLRELSKPTTGAGYPQALQTRAWAMKGLNTQLASWAQLRHDTILYAKQSHTMGAACEYPAGYVEPVPHAWNRLGRVLENAANLLEGTPFPEWHRELQKRQASFLRDFARTVGRLEEIAAKELAETPLTADETDFLRDVVEIEHGSGFTRYNGWYPGLFYKGRSDAGRWDAVVADVHTDPPTPVSAGSVLHEAVGNVDLLVIAVDSGPDRAVYLGPVLSHYELEKPMGQRLSDSEWRKALQAGAAPPRPEWTREYLVPGTNPRVRHYHYEPDSVP